MKTKLHMLLIGALLLFSLHGKAQDIKVEAESGTLNGVAVLTAIPGYSGTGYVGEFVEDEDNLVLNFNAPAGLYDLTIRFSSHHGAKGFTTIINGANGGGMFPQTAVEFADFNAGKYTLTDGAQSITFQRSWGWYYIDYILLSPSTNAPPPVKPPKKLSDLDATDEACSLHSFLVDIYGTKMLAGQTDGGLEVELDYILEKTGKEPAVLTFDLIEYSPSRIAHGANPGTTTENYIAWASKGQNRGILSVHWHWNAPTDLINEEPDKLWWSGFYTRATTFDIEAVLADKAGDKYALLLSDIDAIAVQLKKLQDANVPVLWRPLHEAHGGWFWWGAKGAGPFKELWQILYDRLTNHHDLHNLIWVYTGNPDMNWYPGDAYVDIVSMDLYTTSLQTEWTAMQANFAGKKLIALSESDKLPLPDDVKVQGSWWSWFALWSGDYTMNTTNMPVATLQTVFQHEDVLTLDELPDWKALCENGPFTNLNNLEAEHAILTGVTVASTDPGFSDIGYVESLDNPTDNITYRFNATAGNYVMKIVYRMNSGVTDAKGTNLTVNHGTTSEIMLAPSETFTTHTVAQPVVLRDGVNVITLATGWGWYKLDYISLTPVVTGINNSVNELTADVFPNPSDNSFTLNTKAMIKDLTVLNIFGQEFLVKKNVSGNRINFGDNLPAGSYVVKINYANGTSGFVKIVKIK